MVICEPKKIVELNINEKYKQKIRGLGEIYEIMSVEKLRRRLLANYTSGMLFLCSNKCHSGRGLTKKELEKRVTDNGYKIVESGFVDCPPWPSRSCRKKSKLAHRWIILLCKTIIFKFLLLFEFLCASKKRAHMTYVFAL